MCVCEREREREREREDPTVKASEKTAMPNYLLLICSFIPKDEDATSTVLPSASSPLSNDAVRYHYYLRD